MAAIIAEMEEKNCDTTRSAVYTERLWRRNFTAVPVTVLSYDDGERIWISLQVEPFVQLRRAEEASSYKLV